MSGNYYKMPFDFSSVIDESRGNIPMCNELESVDQHIELLISTYPGEHAYDCGYGTDIWELDFERIVSLEAWKTKFIECLATSISKYEKRISDCQYRLEVEEVLHENSIVDNVSVRRKVDIFIEATLNSTGDPCGFYYTLYLGPLSKD
ncbi:MAG: GPW/gp25 family protein [Paludibacteraceae bacterium]|nr:GPW/gp25 family protein [Paludibacteraceae bacterium]